MAQVKLILKQDVANLGVAGDLVSVKPGYARNYLLPQGKAILATESRVKELEQRLLDIFRLAFRNDHVAVDSDFFALGGDSMLAIQIGMRANDAGLELSPADLFEHRSIAALAVAARARRAGASPAQVPKREQPANLIELAPGELDAILEQVTGPER